MLVTGLQKIIVDILVFQRNQKFRVIFLAFLSYNTWRAEIFAIVNYCGINFCDLGILRKKIRNLFLQCQCFNKISLTKSKKKDMMYMGIIYASFLLRNLLCKNIYTMPSFMWSNELLIILKWWLYLYCILYLVF